MSNPSSLKLYRDILRSINRKLPKQTQNYYWVFTREHFEGHRHECDQEHIDYLVEKGYDSLKYIIKKYTNK
ncbi:hypothetical protein DICPUDRAFT_153685 [Dictyostelium purpureum]|uniref:Complex 1 LYR protein domain-containing protein n=1 Tax=Dictyostelium purpureum TaxID=5786 RepID=F0ZPI3_DICPU|nr:uncharacterized protein DICPUDRAFT_153685 [Dictyostelium purpureum]EGC34128.1 hypothetical protein DICPUDRAFT_153685 [Dictyostelium purpureum]|eukprot:XP_003289326.1 hypothetical protein DICPUDRAFT_153685 [Dictyostelium purpureum]